MNRHFAGDTLYFTVSVPQYPASDGWTLKYRLTPRFATPTQAPIELTSSVNPDGERYDIQVAPEATADWASGSYGWSRWVEKLGARQTLSGSEDQGELLVLPNPATVSQGADTRSHARKMLDAIEACLQDRATSSQREMVSYAIGSRSMSFDTEDTKSSLLTLHNRYKWLVYNEEVTAKLAAGLPNPRNVRVRFGGA